MHPSALCVGGATRKEPLYVRAKDNAKLNARTKPDDFIPEGHAHGAYPLHPLGEISFIFVPNSQPRYYPDKIVSRITPACKIFHRDDARRMQTPPVGKTTEESTRVFSPRRSSVETYIVRVWVYTKPRSIFI